MESAETLNKALVKPYTIRLRRRTVMGQPSSDGARWQVQAERGAKRWDAGSGTVDDINLALPIIRNIP